jgi:tRNA threonylcarbamoyladenosine biosynthesis protein TsaE
MKGITCIDMNASSQEELKSAAQALLVYISSVPGSIIGLSGDLGAGKTTFVQTLAELLGVQEKAISPTFVIRRSYVISPSSHTSRFKKLVHVDAYRIEKEAEVASTGILQDMKDPETLLVVEWPERLGTTLSSHAGYIGTLEFSHISEGTRHLKFVPSTS